MADKQPENQNGFLELIKKLWVPIAGFFGAITLAYNFYKLWLGDQTTVTYFLAGDGLFIIIILLFFVLIRRKTITRAGFHPLDPPRKQKVWFYALFWRLIAIGGLGLISIFVCVGVFALIQHRKTQENKLIVLVARFDVPEKVDHYGLQKEIFENLNANFSGDKNIEIISIDETINGSEYTHELGKKYLADIVIWGSYLLTENPNIRIHIENLSLHQLLPLQKSKTFQPVTTLSELESISFQQQVGDGTSTLISFLLGYIEYKSENYETAIKYLDGSLITLPESPLLFENLVEIYFYRGISHLYLTNYDLAIKDYDQAIQINPQYAEAYNNRGYAYSLLGEYERAIQDYDQAIQINPQDEIVYNNRGNAYKELGEYERAIQNYDQAIQINPQDANVYYSNRGASYSLLGQHERAIQDFDKAIQINPRYAEAYNNRGIAYANLGESERALQDFDQAIQINPQDAMSYYNRGITYHYLDEYERAIQDYDQAIKINPQFVVYVYNNRGLAYADLGEYERAIQDYDQAIEINSQHAKAYYNRGLAYQALGKIAEAEADFAKYKELTGQDAP